MSSSQRSQTSKAALEKLHEGRRLLRARDYEGTIVACEEALDLDASLHYAHTCRATAYRRLGLGKPEAYPPKELHQKHAWLASLLNIFPYPLGFGYLYLGHPGRFTLASFAGLAAGVTGLVGGFFSGFAGGSPLEGVVAMFWAPVLVGMLTAADGWRLAVANNATLGMQPQDTEKLDPAACPVCGAPVAADMGMHFKLFHS